MTSRWTLASALAMVSAACAGPGRQSAPPVAPGAGAEAPASSYERDEFKNSESQQPSPSPGFAQPALASMDEAEATLDRHSGDLASALGTAPDCEVARKALDSMRRSAARICDLNGPADPGERCVKAKSRVDSASDKVRRGCGP